MGFLDKKKSKSDKKKDKKHKKHRKSKSKTKGKKGGKGGGSKGSKGQPKNPYKNAQHKKRGGTGTQSGSPGGPMMNGPEIFSPRPVAPIPPVIYARPAPPLPSKESSDRLPQQQPLQQVQPQPQQQQAPPPPSGQASLPPPRPQQPQQQQQQLSGELSAEMSKLPPPPPPRGSNSLSGELSGPVRPVQPQQQQQQRPSQMQQPLPRPQLQPARPQLQQQQPRLAPPSIPSEEKRTAAPPPSPPELTEKQNVSKKKRDEGKTKLEKLLEVRYSSVVNAHRDKLGELPHSVSRAAFDENMCLNRFEDVICIDQTRVLLSDPSLYLNANWVKICEKKKAIVAQIPLPECAPAFWTMIAENDIKGVLIFCDDKEFISLEVQRTFPLNKTTVSISRGITVTHTHRLAVNASWTMNVYLLCKGDIRKYVHVHFYASAGEGVLPLKTLWQIQSVFRKYKSAHVYMSSAGVGRAATFAALNIIHAKLHDDSCDHLSLTGSITTLREQRLHSVQSVSQATSLHAALLQHIIDYPGFEKKEQEPKVKAFFKQYNEQIATGKEPA